jgi:hypothetical protein
MNGSQPNVRTAAVLAMGFAALVWAVVGAFTLLALPMTLMAFDAPGSENNPWIYAMIVGWALVPLLSLISVPGCAYAVWREFHQPLRVRTLWVLGLLPALGGLIFLGSSLGLEVFCDGSLPCGYPSRF